MAILDQKIKEKDPGSNALRVLDILPYAYSLYCPTRLSGTLPRLVLQVLVRHGAMRRLVLRAVWCYADGSKRIAIRERIALSMGQY
eukprot:1089657-Rhodomonas_salina.2